MKIPMHQALGDRANRTDELVAAGPQVDMIFKPGQGALSLRAAKLWHLLVQAAGSEIATDRLHSVSYTHLTLPTSDLV